MTASRRLRSAPAGLAGVAAAALAGCTASGPSPAPGPVPPGHGSAADAPAPPPVEGRDFSVYRSDGRPATLADVVVAAGAEEVVLLGEEHDDLVGHRLQRALFGALVDRYAAAGRPVVLSLEMFERDVQGVVDEYLAGLVTESHFLAAARPWDDYERRYRPLVELAREAGLPVVAANAPRRYVNRVSRLGAESLGELPPGALASLPPLPYPAASSEYRGQWIEAVGEGAAHMGPGALEAQALWDAAMGHAVARTLERRPSALVVHVAGAFHVERDTGLPEALRHYRPGVGILAVTVRAAEDPGRFDVAEHGGLADFVVLTRRPAG